MFGYLDENDPKRRAPPSYFKVKFHALFIAFLCFNTQKLVIGTTELLLINLHRF